MKKNNILFYVIEDEINKINISKLINEKIKIFNNLINNNDFQQFVKTLKYDTYIFDTYINFINAYSNLYENNKYDTIKQQIFKYNDYLLYDNKINEFIIKNINQKDKNYIFLSNFIKKYKYLKYNKSNYNNINTLIIKYQNINNNVEQIKTFELDNKDYKEIGTNKNLLIHPAIYKLIICKLSDSNSRKNAKNQYFNYYSDKIIDIFNFNLNKYFLINNAKNSSNIFTETYNKYFKNQDNSDKIKEIILKINKLFNDNYINDYITTFKNQNINSYDIDYYINNKKNIIIKKIGLFNSLKIIENILNYCVKLFNIEIIKVYSDVYNILLDNILIGQIVLFESINNDNNCYIINNRIYNDDKFNIICSVLEYSEFVNIDGLCKICENIGKSIYNIINLKETYNNENSFENMIIKILNLAFLNDDNIDIIQDCMINNIDYIELLDLLNDYKHSDYIFNYKKLFIHILSEISIFNNKKFFIECQKKLNETNTNIEKVNYDELKKLIQRVYNELFIKIYDTENYHIKHDLNEIYEIDNDFNLNKKALADFDIILNDVYAYEIFYNYKINKLKTRDIIKIVNEYSTVEDVIKRKIDYEILVFQKPGNHKSYCSTTEGLKNIMDD
jgi:hypothetical protein